MLHIICDQECNVNTQKLLNFFQFCHIITCNYFKLPMKCINYNLVIIILQAVQWQSDLYKETTKFYEKQ